MIKTFRYSFVDYKIVIVCFFLVSFNFNFQGQTNLVPNPSFENYDTCPTQYGGINTGLDQICKAIPWFQPAFPNSIWCGGSTDFYHLCAGSVPTNYHGYQWPRSGLGYAHSGVYVANQNYGREYLEVQLNSTLNSNKNYCTSFYISKSSNLYTSSDCIEAHFSYDSVFQFGSFDRINLPIHINADSIIFDTLNWTLIKGVYTAQGGEKFLTIGCFSSTEEVNYICPTPDPMSCGYSAYYFDDFGVFELPEIEAGIGDTICTSGGIVQLQASCSGCWTGLEYRWWPELGLSDTSVLNPVAAPLQTTTYYFGLIDTSETVPCIVDLIDSVTVYVCDSIAYPTPPDTVFVFTIYPNPGQASIKVVFPILTEETNLYIYDMSGRLVRKEIIAKDTETFILNIDQLANAQYMLKLENSVFKVRRKFVKV